MHAQSAVASLLLMSTQMQSTGKVVFARGSIQPNDVFLNLRA
jgi:hypothetical protein